MMTIWPSSRRHTHDSLFVITSCSMEIDQTERERDSSFVRPHHTTCHWYWILKVVQFNSIQLIISSFFCDIITNHTFSILHFPFIHSKIQIQSYSHDYYDNHLNNETKTFFRPKRSLTMQFISFFVFVFWSNLVGKWKWKCCVIIQTYKVHVVVVVDDDEHNDGRGKVQWWL